jgi:Flp pilus assembly pilin Flp
MLVIAPIGGFLRSPRIRTMHGIRAQLPLLAAIIPLFKQPAAVRRFRKSNDFLGFDQAFDPTLGMIELEWSGPMVFLLKRLIKDASGVTAIEYGLISALIVVGSLLAVEAAGVSLNLSRTFSKVASSL